MQHVVDRRQPVVRASGMETGGAGGLRESLRGLDWASAQERVAPRGEPLGRDDPKIADPKVKAVYQQAVTRERSGGPPVRDDQIAAIESIDPNRTGCWEHIQCRTPDLAPRTG